jgi:hypothetical protein
MVRNSRIYQRYGNRHAFSQFGANAPQLIVFVALNIIPRSDKEGWSLLRSLRSYSIVDLYLALEVHTEDTIQSGRRELENFAVCMQVCILLIFFAL